MANLFLSSEMGSFSEKFFGNPIYFASQVTASKLQQALDLALNAPTNPSGVPIPVDVDHTTAGITKVSYVLDSAPGFSAPVKIEFTVDGSQSFMNLNDLRNANLTFHEIKVTVDGAYVNPDAVAFSAPASVVSLDTNFSGSLNSYLSPQLHGFEISTGDVTVALNSTSLVSLTGRVMTGATFNNAELTITYPDNLDAPSSSPLAQTSLTGNFNFSGATATGYELNGTGITAFSLKTFPGTDLGATPTNTIAANALNAINLDDLMVSDNPTPEQVNLWRQIFSGTQDTVSTTADAAMPEGFENAVILGTGDVQIQGNGQNNTITGNSGDNVIDGGGGSDTFITSGSLASTTGVLNADGSITLTSSAAGVDTLMPAYVTQFVGPKPNGQLINNGQGGGGDDYITYTASYASGPTINYAGGDGNDFMVYTGANTPVYFNGGAGYDTLVVEGAFTVNITSYTLTNGYSGSINNGPSSFNFEGMEALLLSPSANYWSSYGYAGGQTLDIYRGTFSAADYQSFLNTGYAFDGYAQNSPSVNILQGSSVESIQFGTAPAVSVMDVVDGMSEANTHQFVAGSSGSFTITAPQATDGILDVHSTTTSSLPPQMLVLSSGQLMVLSSGNASGVTLERFNANGSPDTTYGGGDGRVDIPTSAGTTLKLVEVPNSNDVLVLSGSGGSNVNLFRVDGSGAHTSLPYNPYISGEIKGVSFASDGDVILIGSAYGGADQDLFTTRLDVATSTWTPASYINLPNDQAALRTASDASGNMYVLSADSSNWTSPSGVHCEIYKIKPDGQLDYSFGGGDGVITTDFVKTSTATRAPLGMTVDSEGKVLIAYYNSSAYTDGSSVTEIEVARYTTSGVLDASFGEGGKFHYQFDDSSDPYAASLPKNLLSVDANDNPILAFNRFWGVEVIRINDNDGPGAVDTVSVLTANGGNGLSGDNTDPYVDVVKSSTVWDRPSTVDVDSNGNVYVLATSGSSTGGFGASGDYAIAGFSATGGFKPGFDEVHDASYRLTSFDGSALPNWVSLDTSGSDPRIVVTAAPDNAVGHHYFVLTASGSIDVSQVFDVFIKAADAGTNDTYVLDKNLAAGSRIVPLDANGNPSPAGLDTLDLTGDSSTGAIGLTGANSDIIVDTQSNEITYWANGASQGHPVQYTFDGFERYLLGASTGYFIGRDDLSEYVVIENGHDYLVVLGSSGIEGAAETDIISFEKSAGGVTIALANGDDLTEAVTATLGSGPSAVHHYISGAEGVIGTSGDDHITGNYQDNFLIGNDGNDELHGGEGNDALVGGEGQGDKLFGGAGGDWLIDLDGGTLQGNSVQLSANDNINVQKDVFVVNHGATIQNFQLSESGTGLAGRAQNANDAVVFNLNLGVIAGMSEASGWSWVNYAESMSDSEKMDFRNDVIRHTKFDEPIQIVNDDDTTDILLNLYLYENRNPDGTFSGSKVLVGSTKLENVQLANGDSLVVVGLNDTAYRTPNPNLDETSFPGVLSDEIFGETTSVNLAIALESVKAGTIRQEPGQVVMSAKWDGTEHFYNPAAGDQKIIATNANDTVELLLQTLPGDSAGSDRVYDIGGTDKLSFSNAHIQDLHFDAVRIGREVGNQSLQVSYTQGDGTIVNNGDLTWTGHFRSGIDMALDYVTVRDESQVGGYNTYKMADTVYNWQHGVLKSVDLVATGGEDAIMVGQDNVGKKDNFVIKNGFHQDLTAEVQDVYIWGFDSNKTDSHPTNTLDKIDLTSFGMLDSGAIHADPINNTIRVDIANTSGAKDQLMIHLMDTTNLNSLDDILLYQHSA